MKCFIGRYRGLSTVCGGLSTLCRAVLVVLVFFGSVTALHAATATWDANSEPDIAGYILSYGCDQPTSPCYSQPGGPYPISTDVQNVTSWQLTLSPGRYYFVVQAYNTSGLMSQPSDEVSFDAQGGSNNPLITSLSPTTGPVGTAVMISGANFGASQGSSSVQFNGTIATPTTWSTTSLVVPVPAGATTGPVVVTVGGLTSNGMTFTVTVTASPPSITTLSPTTGPVGMAVTIDGTNFGDTQGSSVVQFNGTAAAPTTWSATSIVVTVPTNAITGSVVVTVDGVASNGVMFTVDTSGALPDPWVSQDVGSPDLPGQATFSAETFWVTGAGADIWDTSDQFQFVYQPLNGDGTITARVDSLQYSDDWAKAGVMIREDLTGDAPNAVVQVTAGNGLGFQQRDARGDVSTSIIGFDGSAPQWLRLVRTGDTFDGYYSLDGIAWTQMGSFTIALPTPVYVGLSVTSRNPSVTTTAAFSNVTVTGPVSSMSAPASTTSQTMAKAQSPVAAAQIVSSRRVNWPSSIVDFDGDRKSDITVFHPATGVWSSLTSSTNFISAAQFTWGTATDIPVPGDFDGDGRTDVAVFSPSTGTWNILLSSTNYTESLTFQWGASGDRPVPADYDGDGKTDIAVFRPSTGSWYILQSSTNYTTSVTYMWGGSGDRPVVGDYDGDGRADLGVYRPATGEWDILLSSTSYTRRLTLHLGVAGDMPVPGDYDRDGKTDVAIFRPSTGHWSLLKSSRNFAGPAVSVSWGQSGDIPVAADYDGDGQTDFAVFRPSTRTWYILTSSSGFKASTIETWGTGDDTPLPIAP
jgi:regulation of enolase protein 1 (concanavalin A-like superfamily)